MAQISIKLFLITIVSVLVFNACANRIPPGGGEEDRIPPEIVEVYPAEGTTNYKENYFEVTFDEYVQHNSVKQSVFISPAIKDKIEYNWSGRTLEVVLGESLKPNTTYTVAIGTDVEDVNNRNKMANVFNLTFSTGDKIDKGSIWGRIYDDDPSGIVLSAYRVVEDTINPKLHAPDYISQAGEEGDYKFNGLANGTYRVFALRDEFRDFKYKVEQDEFSAPFQEVVLTDSVNSFFGLNFRLTMEDSTKPSMLGAIMTDKHHIIMELSESVDSSLISANNFVLVDSTDNRQIKVDAFYKGMATAKKYFIAFTDTLNPENDNYLVSYGLTDYSGLVSDTNDYYITVNTKPDTSAPKINRQVTEYEGMTVDHLNPYIGLVFDDAFVKNDHENAIRIEEAKENGKRFSFDLEYPDDASVLIKVKEKLQPKSSYKLFVALKAFGDALGNVTDTIMTYKFKTINELDFSGVYGDIASKKGSDKKYIAILNPAERRGDSYKSNVEENKFSFERVKPGKYLLYAFMDENNNGKYDYGSTYPYKNSEKFVYYRDTLNLRPRWPVGDIVIDFE